MPFLLLCNNRLLMNNGGKLLLRDTVPETEEDCPCYPQETIESYVWDIIFEVDSGTLDDDYRWTTALTNVSIYCIMEGLPFHTENTSIEMREIEQTNCYCYNNVTQTISPNEPTDQWESLQEPLQDRGGLVIYPAIFRFTKGGGYEKPVNEWGRFYLKHTSRVTFPDIVSMDDLTSAVNVQDNGFSRNACPELSIKVYFKAVESDNSGNNGEMV